MGPYWNGNFGWAGWVAMFFGMIINLGIIIFIIYFIIKSISKVNFHNTSNAIEILKERYAKGEIDEEELRKRLETLKRNK